MSCFLKQLEHFIYGPAYGWITLCWGFRYLPGSLSKKVFGFSCSLGKVGSTVFKNYSFFLCISVWLYECEYSCCPWWPEEGIVFPGAGVIEN